MGGGGGGREYSTFVIRADTLPPNYTIFNHPVFRALGPKGPKFYSKGIFSQLGGGAFCGRSLEYRKKPLASKFPFHDESLARKSKFLEQSGGGGGGWVCQPKKL